MGRQKSNYNKGKRKQKNKSKASNRFRIQKDRCFNPFNIEGHAGRYLRKAPYFLIQKFKNPDFNAKICNRCRKSFDAMNSNKGNRNNRFGIDKQSRTRSQPETPTRADNFEEDGTAMNMESDAEPDNRSNDTTQEEIEQMDATDNDNVGNAGNNDLKIIFENLKSAFSALNTNDPLRVRILTIAPENWTLRKTAEEFGTTVYSV